MTWNYRVCKETYKLGTPEAEEYFSIREVYYDGDKITGVTKKEVGVSGYTVDDIKFSLEKMQLALNKDVVDVDALWPDQAGLV
jgi:hypothetical protein